MFQLIGSYVPWSLGLPVITTVYFIPSSGKYLHISSNQIFISNSSGIYKKPLLGAFFCFCCICIFYIIIIIAMNF